MECYRFDRYDEKEREILKIRQMKKCNILILLFSISTLSIWGQEVKKWSLKDCINYAIENNIQVKQQELSLEDADINIKDAKGAYLPDLNGSARNQWINSLAATNNGNPFITNAFLEIQQNLFEIRNTIGLDVPDLPDAGSEAMAQTPRATSERVTNRNLNISLNSSITIFNGMRNKYQLQQAKFQKIANQYNNDRLKDDIRLQIANSYLQSLLTKANIEVLTSQNEITKQQIERTNILIEAGNLPKGDILELKATSANERQAIVTAKNNYLISLLSLKQQLNLKLQKPIELEEINVEIGDSEMLGLNPNSLIETVLGNRNEIKFAEQNLLVADKSIDLAKGNYLPTLNGFAGISSFESDVNNNELLKDIKDNFQYNFGLNLNVPFFNKNLTKNAVSRAKVSKMRLEFELEQTKQRLTQNVYQAYLDAQASQKSFEAAEIARDAQKTAFEYAKNRFEAGVSNSFEFNQVKLRFQNSEIELIRTKYDLLFKLKLLELYYTGKIKES